MKLKEAKALCPKFTPMRGTDNKVRCKFINTDNETCLLPSEFRCKLKPGAAKAPEPAAAATPKAARPPVNKPVEVDEGPPLIDEASTRLLKEALLTLHADDKTVVPAFRKQFGVVKVSELEAVEVATASAWINAKLALLAQAPVTAPETPAAAPKPAPAAPPVPETALPVQTQLEGDDGGLDAALDAAGEIDGPAGDFAFGDVCKIGDLPEGTYAVGIKSGRLILVMGRGNRPGKVAIQHHSDEGTPGVVSEQGVSRDAQVCPYLDKASAVRALSNAKNGTVEDDAPLPAGPPVANDVRSRPSWDRRWSVSRFDCGMECLRKFWLRYFVKVPDTNPSKHLGLGTAFHKGVECIVLDKPYTVPSDLPHCDATDMAKLACVLGAFAKRPPVSTHSPEERVDFALPDGTPMVGYLDGQSGATGHGLTIVDYKYTAAGDNYSIGSISRQAAAYLYAKPEAKAFALVTAAKSKAKMKAGESIEDFKARVSGAMLKKDPFEVRVWERSDFPVEAIMDEMARGVAFVRWAMDNTPDGTMPPASRNIHCGGTLGCNYLDLCEAIDGGYIPDDVRQPEFRQAMQFVQGALAMGTSDDGEPGE